MGGRLGQLKVFTGDGSVALKLEPGTRVEGEWDVTTQDGGVVVYVPPDFAATIDAATGDGTIKVDHGMELDETMRTRHALRAAIGAGGRVLRIRSGDGSIALRRIDRPPHATRRGDVSGRDLEPPAPPSPPEPPAPPLP